MEFSCTTSAQFLRLPSYPVSMAGLLFKPSPLQVLCANDANVPCNDPSPVDTAPLRCTNFLRTFSCCVTKESFLVTDAMDSSWLPRRGVGIDNNSMSLSSTCTPPGGDCGVRSLGSSTRLRRGVEDPGKFTSMSSCNGDLVGGRRNSTCSAGFAYLATS